MELRNFSFAVSALLFTILSGTPCLGAKKTPPPIPPEYKRYVDYDQIYNTFLRSNEIKPEPEAEPVLTFDVPLKKADVFQSQFLDKETLDRVLIKKDGERFARFFIVDHDDMELNKIREKYSLKEGRYFGVWLQSHRTYLIWDTENPKSGAFFAKMQIKKANDPAQAELAIVNNDFVEKALKKEGPFISYYPERLGTAVEGKKFSYANIIRGGTLVNGPTKNSVTLPLHGFLGSPAVKNAASKKGMTVQQWIQSEYLPKLARWHAELNLKHGIFIEGHTQNTLINMNEDTGEILGFGFRDMYDIMVDPAVRIARGLEPMTAELREQGLSQVNVWFVDREASEAKDVGIHFNDYNAQSLLHLFEDEDTEANFDTYFHNYIGTADRISGKHISLEGHDPQDFADVFRAVYNEGLQNLLPDLKQENFLYDQSKLRKVFKDLDDNDHVAYPFDDRSYDIINDKKARLGFAVHNKSIYMLDENGRTLAIAYSLDDQQLRAVKAAKQEASESASTLCFFSRLQKGAAH